MTAALKTGAAAPRPPASLVAGPLADRLAHVRNDVTAALKQALAVPPGETPDPAQLAAIRRHVFDALTGLLPAATALCDDATGREG